MMNPLEFASRYRPKGLGDLMHLDVSDIPRKPGVYIMIAKQTAFIYPNGCSPVFYIGMSQGLFNRLVGHRKKIQEAQSKSTRSRNCYRPLYEYAAKFGVEVAVVEGFKDGPRELESRLLAEFAIQFRAPPVANSAVNWGMIHRHIPGSATG
jgi:hypothetical protein